ncbi:MAG: hypothetical protein ACPGWR_03885 [Ardenticatenaceae bacterium]
MSLTTVLVTGGVLATSRKVYLEKKKKKKGYWAFYADKISAKRKPTRSPFDVSRMSFSGLFKQVPQILP